MAGGLSTAQRYHHQLVSERDNPAWIYLTQERGLRPFTIKQWKLGVVATPARGHEKYVGRISIPYFTGLGEYRGLRYRRIDGRRPKYEGDPGVQSHLFAPKYASESLVYVVEGEIDTMTLWQLGLKTVGVPGANHFRKEWAWMFRNADHVVGVLDGSGDPAAAGQFKAKLAGALKDIVPMLTFKQMPEGHDSNSLLVADKRRLKKLLEVR